LAAAGVAAGLATTGTGARAGDDDGEPSAALGEAMAVTLALAVALTALSGVECRFCAAAGVAAGRGTTTTAAWATRRGGVPRRSGVRVRAVARTTTFCAAGEDVVRSGVAARPSARQPITAGLDNEVSASRSRSGVTNFFRSLFCCSRSCTTIALRAAGSVGSTVAMTVAGDTRLGRSSTLLGPLTSRRPAGLWRWS
jgi:hypothetical protein